MKLSSFLAYGLLAAIAGYGEERPTIDSLAGREFQIQDDRAGQELAFRKQGESLVAVWRIGGSGIRIISESEYPVQFQSQRQVTFDVDLGSKIRGTLKVEIRDGPEIRGYLNGVRIPLGVYLGGMAGSAAARPTIDSLVGRTFVIEDDSLGQELAFRKQGESLVAVWRILKSGGTDASEIEYPVVLPSAWQVRSEVELRDKSHAKIKVGIGEGDEIQIHLNGVRIRTVEKVR